MDEINLPIKHESKPYLMVPLPDGATNGDVIKALFKINGYTPMMFCCTRRNGYHLHFKDIDDDDLHMSVSERWWYAPYKAESDIEKRKEWPHKPCINYEDGCEEWAGCPCVHYKAESEEV